MLRWGRAVYRKCRNALGLPRLARLILRGFSRKSLGAPPPPAPIDGVHAAAGAESQTLARWFEEHREGRGVWKWRHYFEIYERHLRRFVGREVHVLEIGVFSGGSLEMWKSYFGPKAVFHGVDVEPACKAYEGDQVKIWIGDQADRRFWKRFREEVERVDVILDDGGHLPPQQMATLEEMIPHLQPGGVYICEDVHGRSNSFSAYVAGLAQNLNAVRGIESNPENPERRSVAVASPFQRAVHSFHLYPYVVVIEKRAEDIQEFVGPRHGTIWEPFLR